MKINTNVNRFVRFIPQLSACMAKRCTFYMLQILLQVKTSTKWRNALQYKHSLHITAAFFNYENIKMSFTGDARGPIFLEEASTLY